MTHRLNVALILLVALLGVLRTQGAVHKNSIPPTDRPQACFSRSSAPARQPIGAFPEADARIREILLHFDPEVTVELFPLYRDLIGGLASDVRVWVVVEDEKFVPAAVSILAAAGADIDRTRAVSTSAPLSVWARDRLLARLTPEGLVYSAPDRAHSIGGRDHDLTVAGRLGELLEGARGESLPVSFEGGDLLIGADRAFVGSNTVRANRAWSEMPIAEIESALSSFLFMPATVVGRFEEMPHEHLDMFLTVVGGKTLLLGDPLLGAGYLEHLRDLGLMDAPLLPVDQWAIDTQERFHSMYEPIRVQLEGLGYRVERVPILHGEEGVVLTWNNALIERRGNVRIAYVPSYGVVGIDRAAHLCYQRLGLQVVPVDCARLIRRGGAVRCVTNVLRWDRDGEE